MVERAVVLEAEPDEVWSALTEPERLSDWLGGDVDLDVRPGGTGSLVDPDGRRHAVLVEDVVPGRRLCLWWWPDDDGDEPASAVSFELESVEVGTRLRIVEAPGRAPATVPGAWAMASVRG